MTESNPLLAELRRVISKTVMISFPTQGKFYHDGVLTAGTNVNEITVNPLSVNAELILRDPILMAAGRAIPKMISLLVPQVLDPEELSDIDVEVLLIAVRLASYGAELNIDHVCSNPALVPLPEGVEGEPTKLVCEETNTLRINLIDHIQKFVPITDWTPYRMEFVLDETSKQIVHLRRRPYKSVLNGVRQTLMAENQMEPFRDKTFDQMILNEETLAAYETMSELLSATNLDSILEMIVSVEMVNSTGTTMFFTNDQEQIVRSWLWAVPGEWIGQMNARLGELNEGLAEMNTIKYECQHCKHKNLFQMQLDVNKLFFSRPQPTSPPVKASATSPAPSKSKPRPRSRTSSR